jgi:hypothetical protein
MVMSNLDEFIARQKRLTQFGNPTSPADQAAKDILTSVNDGLDRICMNWLWDWLITPLTIDLVPGTFDYTLDASVRKIIGLDSGNLRSINEITPNEYLNFKAKNAEGSPEWYMYIGRDAVTGARKVRIGNIPSTATTLVGLGKLKLSDFTESDLGTAKTMLPLPQEGENVLEAFVLADIYRLQGKKDLIFPQSQSAEGDLKRWRGEEATNPSNKAQSNLPAYLRIKMQNRRNGYVV